MITSNLSPQETVSSVSSSVTSVSECNVSSMDSCLDSAGTLVLHFPLSLLESSVFISSFSFSCLYSSHLKKLFAY